MSHTNPSEALPTPQLGREEFSWLASSIENSDTDTGPDLTTPQSPHPTDTFVLKVPTKRKDLRELKVEFRNFLEQKEAGWQDIIVQMYDLSLDTLECNMLSLEHLKKLRTKLNSKLEGMMRDALAKGKSRVIGTQQKTRIKKPDLLEFLSAANAITKSDQEKERLERLQKKIQQRAKPARRKCSICRKTGHRIETCPQRKGVV